MADKQMTVRAVSAVCRYKLHDSVVVYECEMPASLKGRVTVWATYGQRKRIPAHAKVLSDDVGKRRKLRAAVWLPESYSACTVHVIVCDEARPRFASCHVTDPEFRELVNASCSAEDDRRYHKWFLAHRATASDLAEQRVRSRSFAKRPLISIVTPVFRTPEAFLAEFVSSVLEQTYDYFELVLVNVSGECDEVDRTLARFADERIRVIVAPNRTIPENTNVGIEAAKGDYIAFVDHDDFIEPGALFRYVEEINRQPEYDLLFCDEDLWHSGWDGGRFCGARFKPGWNPDLLNSGNYACHMLMVSRWALDRVELSGIDVNGAQDFDLTLKVSEVARAICHVEGVLYHWRMHEASTASNWESKTYAIEAGRVAIQSHFERLGIDVRVTSGRDPFTYHVGYPLEGIGDVSVVLVDGNSAARPELGEPARCLGREVEIVSCGGGALNDAIAMARGGCVVVLDARMDAPGWDWLNEVVGPLLRPDIGCSSAPVLGDDGFMRSSGLSRGSDGVWRHMFAWLPEGYLEYMLMARNTRNVTAVPMRCLAFRKVDFERVGGFDEKLPLDWAAIDLCLKFYENDLLTILVPHAPVYCSREEDDLCDGTLDGLMCSRHPSVKEGDLYIDSLLDQASGGYRLVFEGR